MTTREQSEDNPIPRDVAKTSKAREMAAPMLVPLLGIASIVLMLSRIVF